MINLIKFCLYQEKFIIVDSKEMFIVFNSFLIYDVEIFLLLYISDQIFFDDFVYFFYNKVQRNRYGLIKFNFNDYIVFLDFKGLDMERNG